MPSMVARASGVLAFGLVASIILAWGYLPSAWQRVLAILSSAAGLVFLMVALNTEGLRESPTVTSFLLGTPYVARPATAAASASLPYYVLMAVSLLLGTLGLALKDDTAESLEHRWLVTAISLSGAVTAVRFALEKVAAPPALTYPVGIVWLSPLVGILFALRVVSERRGLAMLIGSIAGYTFASRGIVAAVSVVASAFHLGTHYDVTPFMKVWLPFWGAAVFEPGSAEQIIWVGVIPQLGFWTLFSAFLSLLSAAVTLAVSLLFKRIRRARAPGIEPEK